MATRLNHVSTRAKTAATALGLVAALAGGCGSSGGGETSRSTTVPLTSPSNLASVHGRYSPSIDPANFVVTIDNRYFPLEPGTGFHYRGVRGTTPQTDDEIVTRQTKQILGI